MGKGDAFGRDTNLFKVSFDFFIPAQNPKSSKNGKKRPKDPTPNYRTFLFQVPGTSNFA